jgi:hypothetical protein
MDFQDVAVPTQRRSTVINPFIDVVGAMRVDGPAKQFVMAGYTDKVQSASGKSENWADKNVARIQRQLTEAGNEHNVTVRRTMEDHKNGELTVTFWCIPKIVRGTDATDDDTDETYDDEN